MESFDVTLDSAQETDAKDYQSAPEKGPNYLDSVSLPIANVAQSFRRATLLHQRTFGRMLALKGSHAEEALCLRLLAVEEGTSQRKLAELMDRSPQAVSLMLAALERAGSIERRSDPEDRRISKVYLTPHGRERDRELAAIYTDFLRQSLGNIPEADLIELDRLLNSLVELLSKVAAEQDVTEVR